jgi:hypothetical protein
LVLEKRQDRGREGRVRKGRERREEKRRTDKKGWKEDSRRHPRWRRNF